MFPINNGLKQGDALSFLFTFTLEYVIMRVQVNRGGLKLNGAHQLVVYADEVHILGGSVRTTQKNRSFSKQTLYSPTNAHVEFIKTN